MKNNTHLNGIYLLIVFLFVSNKSKTIITNQLYKMFLTKKKSSFYIENSILKIFIRIAKSN